MKKLFILLSIVFLSTQTYAKDGEFLIKFKKSSKSSIKALGSYLQNHGLELIEDINEADKLYLARSTNQKALISDVIAKFSKFEDIAYIEPNFKLYAFQAKAFPNDPLMSNLWGMSNTTNKGADVKAPFAWNTATSSQNVIVAVIDTGVDYTHEDLKDNMWSKIDNGKVVYGINAISGALDPKDDNGHGTHCSGTVGARGNNGVGVAGVAWQAKIMGAKFLDKNGSGDLANSIKAIDFAINNGARVLSCSWGGGQSSQAMKDAFKRARDKGTLVVVAAGNSKADNDSRPTYPAAYQSELDNMIVVGASGIDDQKASFTNYGAKSVHIFAPGVDIMSTLPGNKYEKKSGTSMATPMVAGAAALYWSQNPNLNYKDVKKKLLDSSDRVQGLSALSNTYGGRLNLYQLMKK